VSRALIVPAAGLGSRLKTSTPKLLVPVNGKAMLDHLFELYRPVVDRFVLVVHPSFAECVREFCEARPRLDVECLVQASPTGMLDAILIPCASIAQRGDTEVWVTWCDQVAVHPETVARLSRLPEDEAAQEALTFPTCRRTDPYIHFPRNEQGKIVGVLHRREGDALPDVGEGDIGLFRLSRAVYLERLTAFANEAESSVVTRERNFLPFIPWLAARDAVRTFPCRDETEAIGVNTPEDLAVVEAYLRERDARPT
jgi:bifunctional UDP-N-acetylglucosamine pyrophosphorylase/glucosamine-1-phosphate N-acetyltransferase